MGVVRIEAAMRINLIPMAGEGQRYQDAGYTVPKPLIEIDGVPMFVRAARALPAADRYIFVCRQNHVQNSGIAQLVEKYFPGGLVIFAEALTAGQAMTCMLAREKIPEDAFLTIGASDCDVVYDEKDCEALFTDSQVDGWIWTFRKNPAVLQNPKMYGWVETDDFGKALHVSCKVPISDNPLEDHAVIGAFTFRRADFFFDAVTAMCAANDRVNNEYYVDVAVNYAIRSSLNIRTFEVDRYICWGTPLDFEIYQYWQEYFARRLACV